MDAQPKWFRVFHDQWPLECGRLLAAAHLIDYVLKKLSVDRLEVLLDMCIQNDDVSSVQANSPWDSWVLGLSGRLHRVDDMGKQVKTFQQL